MQTLIDPARRQPAFEAAPRLPRRRALRLSAGDLPERDEELIGGSPEFSASGQSPLPRVLRGVRVLVVDDDEDTADLFATALSACGADVVTTSTAPDAFRALAAGTLDVVVTDIAMPGNDGYWLVSEIRRLADARVRTLPVLAVTAFGKEHGRARALTAGFVDHLVKPVEPEALCLAVARAVGR